MASARMCDACKAMYPHYGMKKNDRAANSIKLCNTDPHDCSFNSAAIDLCPDCMIKIYGILGRKHELNGLVK